MQVIHVVSSISKINFGIWSAAVFASDRLRDKHRIFSCLWVCEDAQTLPDLRLPLIFIGKKVPDSQRLQTLLSEFHANPENTIIVTHGSWGNQTKIGSKLRALDFVWVYTPHGMLEPWSMLQKKWKKRIYFNLIEGRLAKQASAIRAVGKIEQLHLREKFKNDIWEIENGVVIPAPAIKNKGPLLFLFMGRLHYKKGILPLVQAWNESMQDSGARLIIAGPDEGELDKIKPLLGKSIEYAGAVYGEEKEKLLRAAHFYVLPSFSEGFPTSVVEAMSYGAIPLISAGCNFPEVFAEKLGYPIEPSTASISKVMLKVKNEPFDAELSARNQAYIKENLSEERIAEKLMRMYTKLLGSVNIE